MEDASMTKEEWLENKRHVALKREQEHNERLTYYLGNIIERIEEAEYNYDFEPIKVTEQDCESIKNILTTKYPFLVFKVEPDGLGNTMLSVHWRLLEEVEAAEKKKELERQAKYAEAEAKIDARHKHNMKLIPFTVLAVLLILGGIVFAFTWCFENAYGWIGLIIMAIGAVILAVCIGLLNTEDQY